MSFRGKDAQEDFISEDESQSLKASTPFDYARTVNWKLYQIINSRRGTKDRVEHVLDLDILLSPRANEEYRKAVDHISATIAREKKRKNGPVTDYEGYADSLLAAEMKLMQELGLLGKLDYNEDGTL